MARQTTVAGHRKRQSWPHKTVRPEAAWPPAEAGEQRAGPQSGEASRTSEPRNRPTAERGPAVGAVQEKRSPAPMKRLSVRAQNVLKELAVELTGEPAEGELVAFARNVALADGRAPRDCAQLRAAHDAGDRRLGPGLRRHH